MADLPRKAVVLAAGRGSRMGDLTSSVPKPMLPVRGKPMLEHVVRGLESTGIDQILLVVGYRRDLVINHFSSGFRSISFITQEIAEGTARAVGLAREFAGAEPFLLTFGDIVTDPANYRGIAETLARTGADAVAGVRWEEDPCQGAAVYADEGGLVTRIVEKPKPNTSTTHWNSAGLYALTPEIFTDIDRTGKSARGEYELPTAVELMIARGRRVRFFEMLGNWRDVGRPEDLAALSAE